MRRAWNQYFSRSDCDWFADDLLSLWSIWASCLLISPVCWWVCWCLYFSNQLLITPSYFYARTWLRQEGAAWGEACRSSNNMPPYTKNIKECKEKYGSTTADATETSRGHISLQRRAKDYTSCTQRNDGHTPTGANHQTDPSLPRPKRNGGGVTPMAYVNESAAPLVGEHGVLKHKFQS